MKESTGLKNIVFLKELPSNIVEEAIVVLKSNEKMKKFEKIDRSKEKFKSINQNENEEYIVKEAENLISNYIKNLEEKEDKGLSNEEKRKYKMLKKYACISTIVILLQCILIIF